MNIGIVSRTVAVLCVILASVNTSATHRIRRTLKETKDCPPHEYATKNGHNIRCASCRDLCSQATDRHMEANCRRLCPEFPVSITSPDQSSIATSSTIPPTGTTRAVPSLYSITAVFPRWAVRTITALGIIVAISFVIIAVMMIWKRTRGRKKRYVDPGADPEGNISEEMHMMDTFTPSMPSSTSVPNTELDHATCHSMTG